MAHFRFLLRLVLDDDPGHPAAVELNLMGVTTTRDISLLVVYSRNWIVSAVKAQATKSARERDMIHPSPAEKTLAVDEILDLVVNNNRGRRYNLKLHTSGSGCRYWTKVILGDLVAVGYPATGSNAVVNAIAA